MPGSPDQLPALVLMVVAPAQHNVKVELQNIKLEKQINGDKIS